MPPKTLINTYIELLTRGERISNATLRRSNSLTPSVSAQQIVQEYKQWYKDTEKYFVALGPEASHLFYRHELSHFPEQDNNVYYHYTSKRKTDELTILRRELNKLKKTIRDSQEYVEDQVTKSDTTIVINRAGYRLSFNILTGEVMLNNHKTFMPVGQKKYTALKCIVTGPGQKGTYLELYKELSLENHLEKDRRLHDIMREVKTQLLILPKKDAINPDIFINLQNDGYVLK